MIEKIVKNGYCHIEDLLEKETSVELLKSMAAHDVWLYKTHEQKISDNSQSLCRAFEKLMYRRNDNKQEASRTC
ncbi:hypothetical protein U27_06733 [Candidatus Vecturithrix granuli]|uniref:Uncharacterized protein n=1 Tax=Vecturithrix granuli TaxID=1499967 RepID=A0A081C593_VECG1|nr:hypothetical protein U27_06733 [Candidatus Vecturithrix granuli]